MEGRKKGRGLEWEGKRKEKNCLYRKVFTCVISKHTLKKAQILT